eukprot:g10798.t1
MESSAHAAGVDQSNASYSLIILSPSVKPSSQFRHKERVRFFSPFPEGAGVVSAQYVDLPTRWPPKVGDSPFHVKHPAGVDKRVRMVFLRRELDSWPASQQAHLQAWCDDEAETTVIVIIDETCAWAQLNLPKSCQINVIRIYPFNNVRSDLEYREAYMPLGPNYNFQFVDQEKVEQAAERSLFLNLQVSTSTSPRREGLVAITEEYGRLNPEITIWAQQHALDAGSWQALLLRSKFTICPGGHSPETYRMWEALESGSIPIVSRLDYHYPVYNKHVNVTCGTGDNSWNTVAGSPFAEEASVDSWEDLPALLDKLREMSQGDINKLQEDCMAWYAARMTRTYNSLLHFGEGHDMFPQEGPILHA